MKSILALVGMVVVTLVGYAWMTDSAVGLDFGTDCVGATYLDKEVDVCTGEDSNGNQTVTIK